MLIHLAVPFLTREYKYDHKVTRSRANDNISAKLGKKSHKSAEAYQRKMDRSDVWKTQTAYDRRNAPRVFTLTRS